MRHANVWALVAAVAVAAGCGDQAVSPPGHAAPPGRGTAEIPPNWLTEKEFGASGLFAGLTAAQRRIALEVLNTKPCSCGCPHGSIAKCRKEDPACPLARQEVELAVREARAGKSYDEVYAAAKRQAQPAAQPAKRTQ